MSGSEEEDEEYTDENGEKQVRKVKKKCKYDLSDIGIRMLIDGLQRVFQIWVVRIKCVDYMYEILYNISMVYKLYTWIDK